MIDPSPLNLAETLAEREPAKKLDLTRLWFLDPDWIPAAPVGVSPATRDDEYRAVATWFIALLPESIATAIRSKGDSYGGTGENLLFALYESLDEVITWKENQWHLQPRT